MGFSKGIHSGKPLLSLHFFNPFTEVNGNKNTSILAMCYYYCRQLFPKGWLCQADGFNNVLSNWALATF
jgi:hypothetical protein